MSRHLGSVSGVRRSWAFRSVARVAIAGQLLTMLPATASAAQSPIAFASFATAAAARAAREADEKLAELRLPPGALLGDEIPAAAPAPRPAPAPAPSFTSTLTTDDDAIETLLADYVLGAEQRPTTGPGDRRGSGAPPIPEPKRVVVVNRTVPRVTPRAIAPALSADPVDREFFDARIFAEPLVPIGATTAEDNRALGQALRQYLDGRNRENVSIVLAHLQQFPASPWRASLLANIGTVFSQHGYYTRAFQSWDAAWQLSKNATDPRARAVADYAIAQWLELMTRFGDVTALEGKLKELEGRKLTGSTGARIKVAREGLWILKNHHEWATPSARTALAAWLYSRSSAYARERARVEMSSEAAAAAVRANASAPLGAADGSRDRDRERAGDAATFRMPKALTDFHARVEGTSLRELANLAAASGLRVRTAYRPAGAPLITPAIAHLKPGHYAFVLKQEEGRVLLRDAILGGEIWFSRAALEEESSGYWLITDSPLPNDWRAVQEHEANVVIGRCAPGGADDRDPCGCEEDSHGMPTYKFHPVSSSLRLIDTPLGYTPPRGPAANFTVSYNHREVLQPSTFSYSNLGPMWTYDWLSYVQEVPITCPPGNGNCINAHVIVFLRRSGAEEYRNPDVNGVYPAYFRTRAVLVKVSDSPVRYERRLPDGSMEVFTQSDGAASGQRQIFLTSIVDPQGQALQITYDAQLRAVAFTDALGQVTIVSYDHPTDPLKITKITDPFGRFATVTYTPAGQLGSITDTIGLTSSFIYTSDDFISALKTPYGTTTFRQETTVGYPRMIEATDPLGGTEHQEYHYQNTSIVNAETASLVPTGFTAFNENLQYYNTFYWSKRQWALHPGDITKATRTHWLLHDRDPDDQNHGVALSIPLTIKQPLENTVWYAYPGQVGSKRWVGSLSMPERVGRVLDDGTSQITEQFYNAKGRTTAKVDPLGRRTSLTYASNGIDLTEIRQTTGALNDLLVALTYSSERIPATVTDAAGQVTTFTHNSSGQLTSATNPRNETSTSTFDANGYLQATAGPASGSATTYTYDSLGRVRTTTDPDGGTITLDYDAGDRVTRRTFADGTFEEITYDRLHVSQARDRMGRRAYAVVDALRRTTSVRDTQGRTITFQYCACGSLDGQVDAGGQKTSWLRDLQGRVTRELRADGVTATDYTYENTTGRLKTIKDPLQQQAIHAYNVDGTLQSITFANALVATPSISYIYDSAYRRPLSMQDGTGTTTYAYHPLGVLGAMQLATVDGPLTNDTIALGYDELGRVNAQTVNGVGATMTFDSLGRVITESNPLGGFVYGYDGVSNRIASVQYPNGQSSEYTYFGVLQEHQLHTIHHRKPDTTTLSKFDYTYDANDNILTLQEQLDASSPAIWRYSYDAANQLTTATRSTTGVPVQTLNRYAYGYDAARNRTTEQIDDAVTKFTYDSLNRLTEEAPGGALRFAGTVNEPATVTVDGQPAAVDVAGMFVGRAVVSPGSNTVGVRAVDASGNITNVNYQVNVAGTGASLAYDANGNLTSDSTRTFEWNARNQLIAINWGLERSEFTYDGLGRRVRVVEKHNSVTVQDTRLIWCGEEICEERAANGVTVTKRLFQYGEQIAGTPAFVTRDYLDNPRDVTDASAGLVARYAFDPWGRKTLVTGTDVTDIGFAGQRAHRSGLSLATFRVYDPARGRFISQDPIGLAGGMNLYSYTDGNPIGRTDADGLDWSHIKSKWKPCGDGCWVRVERAGDPNVGLTQHVHWKCGRGRQSGTYGGPDGESHGGDESDAPRKVRECAERWGYRPVRQMEMRFTVPPCGAQCIQVVQTIEYVLLGVLVVAGTVVLVTCS